jgi:hypothetical protein
MQAAKDSFYMALCARLQTVNPQRTMVIDGEVRPGILVIENAPSIGSLVPEAFCIEWGAASPAINSEIVASTLMVIEGSICYHTCGSNHGECDRGRSLTTMDMELMKICAPQQTTKFDYTQNPPPSLGSRVFWTSPKLEAAIQTASTYGRTARITVYFYPEEKS